MTYDLTCAQESILESERRKHMRDVAAMNGAVYCEERDELCYECKDLCADAEQRGAAAMPSAEADTGPEKLTAMQSQSDNVPEQSAPRPAPVLEEKQQ